MPACLFNDTTAAVALWPNHRHRGRRTYDYAALGQRREHRHRGLILLARLLQSEHSLNAVLDDFMHQRYERCRMIVQNSELLGGWRKNLVCQMKTRLE